MSVDLWIERLGPHAKVIVVRLLGGLDWWKYGVERLAALARERGIALAVLPGEDRDDTRLVRSLDAAAIRARRIAALFSRRRPREFARAVAAARPPCRASSRRARAGSRPALCRISAGRARSRTRPARFLAETRFGRRADHLLPGDAARCRHRTDRRTVRGADRARPRPGTAVRHQLEGWRRRRFPARRARSARSRGDRHHDGVRRRWQYRRADAARWTGRPGAAGGQRHHATRGLARQRARCRRRRPGDACRPSRA